MQAKRRTEATDLNPRRGRKPGRKVGKLRVLAVKEAHRAANDLTDAIDRMRQGVDPNGDTLSLTIRNYAYKLGFHDRAFCEKAMAELRKLSRWALTAASAA
jgi:hypothetical protein